MLNSHMGLTSVTRVSAALVFEHQGPDCGVFAGSDDGTSLA